MFKPVNTVFKKPRSSTDLAGSFIDWSPEPPDNGMGLWKKVDVLFNDNGLFLSNAFAKTVVDAPLTKVVVEYGVGVLSLVKSDVDVDLNLEMSPFGVKQHSFYHALKYNQFTDVFFSKIELTQRLNETLWWPHQMGFQNMTTVEISISYSNSSSSSKTILKQSIGK